MIANPSTEPRSQYILSQPIQGRHEVIDSGACAVCWAGAMAPGGKIIFPNALLVAALAFGMSQLYTLALNDALLPETLRSLYYSILQSNAKARSLAVLVTAVHIIEAAVALWSCLDKRFSPGVTLYWTVGALLVGFPFLGTVLKMGKSKRSKE